MIEPARTWRVLNLEMGLDEPESALRDRAASAAGIDPERLRGVRIARRSVDARRHGKTRRLRFIVHADLVVDAAYHGTLFDAAVRSGQVVEAPRAGSFQVADRKAGRRETRLVVVGAGPAGLYAALVLATNGITVDLIDRGAPLKERAADVARFHNSRVPNPESNLLFGEGGAGTYSDGKLYTRVDDPLEVPCLEDLVACGATRDILYDSRAHIGTSAPTVSTGSSRSCERCWRRSAGGSTGRPVSTVSSWSRTRRGACGRSARPPASSRATRCFWRSVTAHGTASVCYTVSVSGLRPSPFSSGCGSSTPRS